MPTGSSKLKKEFQMDDEDNVIVPVEDLIVRPSVLKEKVKRPISDKQKENCKKMIEVNKARWASMREAKEREKEAEREKIREEVRADIEAKLKAGTHVRAKVVKSGQGPKPKSKEAKKKHVPQETESEVPTETEPDTTEVEDSDDEPLPPRRAVRQARRAVRTIQKIDEVLEQSSNPYMNRLMGRWK